MKSDKLAEKRTELAELRTNLAYRRTVSADLRTSATMVLFGVAFIGFSKEKGDFFLISGIIAIIVGFVYLFNAITWEHSKKIRFFDKFRKKK